MLSTLHQHVRACNEMYGGACFCYTCVPQCAFSAVLSVFALKFVNDNSIVKTVQESYTHCVISKLQEYTMTYYQYLVINTHKKLCNKFCNHILFHSHKYMLTIFCGEIAHKGL